MLDEAMQLAIQSSREGIQNNEGGPFGAAIVLNDKVISVAHNTVLKDSDPTCHAEINAIRLACKELKTHVLSECELYTTVEPCPMCLAAIYWSRIKKIYVGADKTIAAKYGFDDVLFYEQLAQSVENRDIPCQMMSLNAEVEPVFEEWQDLNRAIY